MRTTFELASQVETMVGVFSDRQWESEEAEEFDAAEFLLAFKKLEVIQQSTTNPHVAQYLEGVFRRIESSLNHEPGLFWLDWSIKNLGATDGGPKQVNRIASKDFFMVPYATKDLLTQESWAKYHACHQSILKLATGDPGQLGSDEAFAALASTARKNAERWFEQRRETLDNRLGQEVLEFKQNFYANHVQSTVYREAKKAIIRTTSFAKSHLNEARNGLEHAGSDSQKVVDAAKQGDSTNATAYMVSARQHGLELAAAANKLAKLVDRANELKRHMVPEATKRVRNENIVRMSVPELNELLANGPRGGNENVVARNTLQEWIEVTKTVQTIEAFLVDVTAQCEKVDLALQQGEQALSSLHSNNEAILESPFDVSSREAFDASKEKLVGLIPTEDYVAFSQAFVKLLQDAIKNDPMVMADDDKYLRFLKENFEGKSVQDIIGK